MHDNPTGVAPYVESSSDKSTVQDSCLPYLECFTAGVPRNPLLYLAHHCPFALQTTGDAACTTVSVSCSPQLICPAIHWWCALYQNKYTKQSTAGVPCCAAEEVMQLLSKGALNRHVAATKANTDSSRSHCVFSCVLESKCTEEGVTSIRSSCLKLVDLAGLFTYLCAPPIPGRSCL